MALSAAQAGVVRGVALALVLIAASSVYALRRPLPANTDRVLLWMKWNAPKAACLAAHVARIGNHRFSTPEDIQGSGYGPGTPQVRLMQGTLQNTLEQLVIAVAAHGAFAALAPAEYLVLVPAFSLTFVVGRVLFVYGYSFGAPGRALGFALTMMTNLLMLVASCVWLLQNPF